MNNNIIIQDWTGEILFEGNYKHGHVDLILEKNRCPYCNDKMSDDACPQCDDTGYIGDIVVYWEDDTRADNVYEYINY